MWVRKGNRRGTEIGMDMETKEKERLQIIAANRDDRAVHTMTMV